MNFVPQFLNATTAAVAAAVAIPLLLLLYFLKLRRMQVPVGSTLLWKKAIQDLQVNSPFQRLRRNLLLLLQLLALLALIFALARPVSEGTAVAGSKTVILIDRSASMAAEDGEGGSRLEEAKERAKALVGTMDRGAQAMVIAFADEAQTVQPFTGDAAALRSAIDSITPTDRPTRLKTAYTLANANMQFDYVGAEAAGQEVEAEQADVFLFSDGRVPESDVRELSLRGRLHYERVGKSASENLAVVAASAKRNYERPTEVQVFARLANFGPAPREAQVRISVAELPEDATDELEFDPVTLQPVQVSLPPARWSDPGWRNANPEEAAAADQAMQTLKRAESVDVRMELGGAAVIRVELVNHSDPLTTDDTAWVVVPPPSPLKTLLVSQDGNYFLKLLLDSISEEETARITAEEYEASVPKDFDLIIFDNYSPEVLPEAGTFLFSGGLPPEGTSNVKPVTQPDSELPLYYEASEILDWEREHPMLQGLNLNRVWVAEGQLLTVPLGARMIMEGVKGPFAILERNGPRTHLIFSFDLTQSTWPQQKTFPIFGYQMLQYLAAGEDVRVRESLRPGELVTIPRAIADRAGVEESVELIGPGGGRSVRADEGGVVTLGPFENVGIYRTEPVLPQFERIAVSLLDDVESNLLPNPTDPGNLSGIEPAQAAAAAAEEEGASVRNIEWWWWLVAAAAVVLLVEWIVYTRRVGA